MDEHDAPTRAEGLLEQIADTALDDDYYVVRAGDYSQSREFNTVVTAAVLAVFAFLVMMAALQTRADRPATERERNSLINDVAARKKSLEARETRTADLRKEVASLSASVGQFDPAFNNLRIQASDVAASGPGVTIVAGPDPLGTEAGRITDSDLQITVNGLWYAGAEAVAINGQRIGPLTAIHTANGVVNVNYHDIAPPYVVLALGDTNSLEQRFDDNPAGRYWAAREKNAGVKFSVTPSSQLSVDAAPKDRVTLRHSTAIKGEQ